MAHRGSNVGKAIRKAEALKLRLNGYTYNEIGQRIGTRGSTAFKYIQEALGEYAKETEMLVDEYRNVELLRCEEILSKLAMYHEEVDKASATHVEKIHTHLSIIDRIAKTQDRVIALRGLAAPEKVEHSGKFDIALMRERANKSEPTESDNMGCDEL